MLDRVRLALTSVALIVTLLAGCLHMTAQRQTIRLRSRTPAKLRVVSRTPEQVSTKSVIYSYRWAQRIRHLRWKLWEQRQEYKARHRKPAYTPLPSSSPANLGVQAFRACVIRAESGGNPKAYNASSGAGGLYQFLPSTWAGLHMGYPGGAQTAPVRVQNAAFYKLYAEAGTSPWAPYDGC